MASPMVCLQTVFAMMNSTPLNVVLTVLIAAVTTFSVIIVLNVLATVILMCSTEPRWAIQPQGTHWFSRIGLFVVQAIILGPYRRPIEFLTSWHPCGRLSKIPNSQIHKVKKWKILSNFRRKDFFVISHGHKDRFFVVIRPKKTPGHIKYCRRIDPTKVGHF